MSDTLVKSLSVTSRFPRFKSLRELEMITRMMKLEVTTKLHEMEEDMDKMVSAQKQKLSYYRGDI